MKHDPLGRLRPRLPFLLFAALYLAFTALTYRDYGITWDEPDCYLWGDAYVKMLKGDPAPYRAELAKAPILRIYSHLYGGAMAIANPSLNAEAAHGFNLLFALLAYAALFEMLLHALRRPWLAGLGPPLLFLFPRFLGDSANNPHDMPFAVMFSVSLAALYFSSRRREGIPAEPRWILGLGLLLGVTHSLRTAGYSLYAIWVLFLAWQNLDRGRWRRVRNWADWARRDAIPLGLVFLVSNLVTFASNPYLHQDPFARWWEMIRIAPRYYAHQTALYLGRLVPSHELPWHYLPVWLGVTIPLPWMILAGATPWLKGSREERPLMRLAGVTLGVHTLLYFTLRPTLLDGMRVYLFLLPVLALVASLGLARLLSLRRGWAKRVILAALILKAAMVGSHLVRLHPYPGLYFNELTGGLAGAAGRFDTDYWGQTYREAVEWLKEHELRDLDSRTRTVRIHTRGNALSSVYYFKPGMAWVPFEEAEYFLSTTRWGEHNWAGGRDPLHVVSRENAPLNYIFKLR